MKKILCILMSLVLAFALFAPISATAAEIPADGQVAPLASCNHSSYTTSYYYSYIFMDNTYHEVYRTERRTCNNPNCGDVFYTGNPQMLSLEKHTCTLSFEKSVHLGDPSGHYYLYSGKCTVCKTRVERIVPSACTPGNCIDPY